MRPNLIRLIVALSFGLTIASVSATSDPFYDLNFTGFFLIHPNDPLAPRDEWGMLHRNSRLDPTDFARRGTSRLDYHYRSGRFLLTDPAYVGMLQTVLRNNGYYCGPIDGMNSDDVSIAIARMQRNYRLRVTGTLTIAVRRSLHLP
jgi:Putative peptidoglycan binding domain